MSAISTIESAEPSEQEAKRLSRDRRVDRGVPCLPNSPHHPAPSTPIRGSARAFPRDSAPASRDRGGRRLGRSTGEGRAPTPRSWRSIARVSPRSLPVEAQQLGGALLVAVVRLADAGAVRAMGSSHEASGALSERSWGGARSSAVRVCGLRAEIRRLARRDQVLGVGRSRNQPAPKIRDVSPRRHRADRSPDRYHEVLGAISSAQTRVLTERIVLEKISVHGPIVTRTKPLPT
jgi:hypothetical protein